jgi:hypothetical protein
MAAVQCADTDLGDQTPCLPPPWAAHAIKEAAVASAGTTSDGVAGRDGRDIGVPAATGCLINCEARARLLVAGVTSSV